MNKKVSSIIMMCILLSIIYFMITASSEIIESVSFSISIWKDNLFPTLFPFFVVSNLLMNYGFVDVLGNLLSYPMQKYFKLPGCCGFVLAASLFSGFPSGAKYTTSLVENKKITRNEASRLLSFTHYANPLFVLGMIGNVLLNNQKLAIIILIAHIISGILVGIIFTKDNNNFIYEKKQLSSIKNFSYSDKSFGELLSNSIFDSLNTMFLLLGIITIFLIVTTIINQIITLPLVANSIVSGILEMTQGVKLASYLNVSELVKIMIITGIISFGGFSVHAQVLGIISKEKIKYKYFLLGRILHSILAILFVFILYNLLLNYIW